MHDPVSSPLQDGNQNLLRKKFCINNATLVIRLITLLSMPYYICS